MKARITDRGDLSLVPENDAERYILDQWTRGKGIWIKSYGWENIGGGAPSVFSDMLIGPKSDKSES